MGLSAAPKIGTLLARLGRFTVAGSIRLAVKILQNATSVAGDALRALSIVRAPLVVGAAGAAILGLPDQTTELYRVLALDARDRIFQIWGSFGALFAAAFLFPMFARALVSANYYRLRTPFGRFIAGGAPAICGLLLPLGAALGLHRGNLAAVSVGSLTEGSTEFQAYTHAVATSAPLLRDAVSLCIAIAICSFLLNIRRIPESWSTPSSAQVASGLGSFSRLVFVLGTGLAVGVFAGGNTPIAEALGILTIVLMFVVCLAFFASVLSQYYYDYRIPAISCLFVVAVVISALNLNDNHVVQLIPSGKAEVSPSEPSFEAWYSRRADKEWYRQRGEPYPVFLVSAAGGGIYAAYYAAQVLARLQDRCPNFAQHVFAISGVSGGSLGAAVFSALSKDMARNGAVDLCSFDRHRSGPMENRAGAVLRRDLLTPLIAAGLFPDFLQRFLPFPVFSFDRARAFNAAVTRSYADALPGRPNPFSEPFLKLWNVSGSAPALILNTTHVTSGLRVPIAPFKTAPQSMMYADNKTTGQEDFYDLLLGRPGVFGPEPLGPIARDIDLATAVGISARFPWIAPAASLNVEMNKTVWLSASQTKVVKVGPQTIRLVDGGYYDNSGMDTLLNLLNDLKYMEVKDESPATKRPFVKFFIVSIAGFRSSEDQSWSGVSELMSPIRAMLSTREQRGFDGIFRGWNDAYHCFGKGCADRVGDWFFLDQDDFALPLGWQLADTSRSVIDLQTRDPHLYDSHFTDDFTINQPQTRVGAFRMMANKGACNIVRVLHPVVSGDRTCQTERGKAFVAKNYDGAISEYDAVLKFNPESARALASRGEAEEMSGNLDAALADYGAAINFDPGLDEAFGMRGRLYLKKADYEHAIADETKAIEINRDPLTYFQRRGDAYLGALNYERAIADYTEVIGFVAFPFRPEWLAKRARALDALGRIDEAIADQTKALRLAPSATLHRERAALYRKKGDDARAAADLVQAADPFQQEMDFLK
jgi:Flp pilus assembly protein TadD